MYPAVLRLPAPHLRGGAGRRHRGLREAEGPGGVVPALAQRVHRRVPD